MHIRRDITPVYVNLSIGKFNECMCVWLLDFRSRPWCRMLPGRTESSALCFRRSRCQSIGRDVMSLGPERPWFHSCNKLDLSNHNQQQCPVVMYSANRATRTSLWAKLRGARRRGPRHCQPVGSAFLVESLGRSRSQWPGCGRVWRSRAVVGWKIMGKSINKCVLVRDDN